VPYSQSSHHACTQMTQATPWSSEIRWISGVTVMALRLSASS
jgi:hypothetical protein